MARLSILIATLIALGLAAPSYADDVMAGGLKISAPWARATPKGASVGGGYLTITNTGTKADRLLGGSTAVAGSVEVHRMSMDNGVMKMRPVTGGLEIKPGETIKLDPTGYHLMIVGLKQPLKEGDHVKVTLDFTNAGKVDVDFAVAGIGAMQGGAMQGGAGGMPGMKMK